MEQLVQVLDWLAIGVNSGLTILLLTVVTNYLLTFWRNQEVNKVVCSFYIGFGMFVWVYWYCSVDIQVRIFSCCYQWCKLYFTIFSIMKGMFLNQLLCKHFSHWQLLMYLPYLYRFLCTMNLVGNIFMPTPESFQIFFSLECVPESSPRETNLTLIWVLFAFFSYFFKCFCSI